MKQLKRYIPALAATLLILLLSLVNPEKLPDVSALHFAGADKLIHLLMYATLTAAWGYALPKEKRSEVRLLFILVFVTSLYGLLLEFCQSYFTASRSMDKLDALANLTGAVTAAAAIYVIRKLQLSGSVPCGEHWPTKNSKAANQKSE
ncbi:MAG: VanZ family protein [Kiritimatiellia bacterium]